METLSSSSPFSPAFSFSLLLFLQLHTAEVLRLSQSREGEVI